MQILSEGTSPRSRRGSRAAACFPNSSFSLVRAGKKKIRLAWLPLILSASLSRPSHSRDTIPPTSGPAEVSFRPFSRREGTSWEPKSRPCHAEPAPLGWRKAAVIIAVHKGRRVLLRRSRQNGLEREAERTANTTASPCSACLLRYAGVDLVGFQIFGRIFSPLFSRRSSHSHQNEDIYI